MKSHVEFTNGQKMPIVGLGLSMRNAEDPVATLETSLNAALDIGYRHLDTAYVYMNEEIIGNILKKWLDSGKVSRQELFITTKLPSVGMHSDKVELFLKNSLGALQLDYVDLYLIHTPFGYEYVSDTNLYIVKQNRERRLDKSTDLEAVWKAMEKQVEAGRAKSMGISNFNVNQIERIVKVANIHPENIQVELNVYFQQKELREVCQKHKITICSYGSLGSPGRKEFYESKGMAKELPGLLDDPDVLQIAHKYNKSAGQILLRFLTQQNIAIIPKSANPARLKQNFDIYDFELAEDDMLLLEGLDKGEAGRSFNFDVLPGVEEHPEYPFK